MIKYQLTKDSSDCCFCRACEHVCAKKAISFFADEEGFSYPIVDETLCVDCGLCQKICPMQEPQKVLNAEGKAYAFQLNNKGLLSPSSSGGAFIAIANSVLDKGGVVYGAAWNGKRVYHRRVDDRRDIHILMGSKYVQSDTLDTYVLAKEDLKQGRVVYYTGTPCQIAGLKLFLRKDYGNLVTSDLICHGTPSPKLLEETISQIEKRTKSTFLKYDFRDKKIKGWACSSSSSSYRKPNGKICYLKHSREMEAYFTAFMAGHLMRMNCYQCPFATYQRVGDLTIADYWGVKKLRPEFPNPSVGMSLILANSERGVNLLNVIAKGNFLHEVDLHEAAVPNKNLRQPTEYHPERETSYQLAYTNYEGFLNKYYKGNYLVNTIKSQVEYFIRSHDWLFALVSKTKRALK